MKYKETSTQELDGIQGVEYDQERGIYIVVDTRVDMWALLDPNADDGFALTPQDKMSGELPRNRTGYEEYLTTLKK